MKKSIIYSCAIALSGLAMLTLSSCGDELKAYPWIAEDDNAQSEENLGATDMDALEKQMRTGIPFILNYSHEPDGSWQPHNYQYNRANSIDNYAGYWTTTKANFSFGPALPTLYTDDNGYISGCSEVRTFQYCKDAIFSWNVATYKTADGEEINQPRPEWRAIALICEAYVAHEYVDAFGVMAYNDTRSQKRTRPVTYEAGPEVYKQIFADLDEAIATLKEAQPGPGDLQRVEGADVEKTMTGWDWRYWVKFANSIKLRMAMNMVDYNDPDPVYGPDSKPFVAKNIAEEAVADEIGVLLPTDSRDIAYYMATHSCVWYFMGNSWNDIRLNASLENILKHFKSPLLNEWFDDNAYAIKNAVGASAPTGVYGVRSGLYMEDTGGPDKGGYGPFAQLSGRHQYMNQPFFKRTEATFLRAEGALRGWNMGDTPENLYNEGIRLSLSEWGIDEAAINKYINQTNLPVVEYRDYYNRVNDIMGRVSCDVKWNEGDTKELKLEKIITQKYIANFPMGAEAWTNFRRTGYPRLFPVVVNNMKNVDKEMQIRRVSFVLDANNGAEIAQITELLGGSQDCGTRVFWDVNSATWAKDENGQYIPDNHLY
ncbi:MAG: SusD/RagB family nutrient-binding outer membrane lipoprotein [Bacteroides sp.]|nr:SusD/RagB family nutrient-binding outer membrane lipoprotein [Bacteroides sp.]MCM1413549.1 SusD/RagB family nutrient-binding outer membrane lipoprotein [Bacteroides sp.]MCM1471103.1 SusD/RagB family nutrient-binding outer membrane lipoprotein [Bacteroides sp.]